MPKRRSRAKFSWKQEYGGMPAWAIAAGLVLIAVLFAAPAVVNATAEPATPYVRPSDAFTEPTSDAAAPVAVWVGDSYTEADKSSGEGFVSIVSDHFGWEAVNLGEGGTGYLTDGPVEFPERMPIVDRIGPVVATNPDVVIVAAGLNDQGLYPDDQLREGVEATLTEIREGLPEATVYVVGPFWPNGYPVDGVLATRDVISEVAGSLGMAFIDPIAGGWITGSNDGTEPGNRVEYIGPDGTHPTPAGQAYLADKLIEALIAAGAQ